MARSGQGGGEPLVVVAAQGGSGSASRPGASGRDHRVAWGLVALGLMAQVLRSRGFYAGLAVTAIAARNLSRPTLARLPVALATMHMAWGLGFLTSPRSLVPGHAQQAPGAGPRRWPDRADR